MSIQAHFSVILDILTSKVPVGQTDLVLVCGQSWSESISRSVHARSQVSACIGYSLWHPSLTSGQTDTPQWPVYIMSSAGKKLMEVEMMSKISTSEMSVYQTSLACDLFIRWCSSVCLSVRLSGTGVHCDHTVHFSVDLNIHLDSPMFWAPWHQSMSTYSQPSFSSSTWKRGGV